MAKKLLIILTCLCIALMVGCTKKSATLEVDRGSEPSIIESTVSEPENKFAINPLTGLQNLEPSKANQRPVAIAINNISVAQPVQTGISKADIVYETEVEGGITRLLAIYKDTTEIEKIGTVRSARYVFVDLALGHNALFVHHGQDSYHAGPHLKDIAHFTVDTNSGGVRISNNLSREHTLYAYGSGLWSALKNAGFKTEDTSNKVWQSFTSEEEAIALENTASSVTVPFSASYKTTFKYDAASGKYIRYFNNTLRKDYITGESLYFKNIFVLNTTIRTYPNCTDGYCHKEVMLNSGDGYYLVNGTYTPIKWSKGSGSNSFKFTKTDGSALTVNAGNSWVCIANMSAKPVIG